MRQARAAHPGISQPSWDESDWNESDRSVHSDAEASIMRMLCDTTKDAPRAIFVTGPRAAGKTAALEAVLARFGQTSTEILRWHFSAPLPTRLYAVLARSSAQGASADQATKPKVGSSAEVIVAIDDAHLMPLETIRVLRHAATAASASPVLRLLLVGAPALLAALPPSTLFRQPGGRCAKLSVRRPSRRAFARRLFRAGEPTRTAKRRPSLQESPPGTPLGAPCEPLEVEREASKPGGPLPSRRANGPALLLILILIVAFLIGDHLLPASVRPAFSLPPPLQTQVVPPGLGQDGGVLDTNGLGRSATTPPPTLPDAPAAPAIPAVLPTVHAAASDPVQLNTLPDGAGTVVVVRIPNSEAARKRAHALAESLERSGMIVERAPVGAPDAVKGVRVGYYFSADRPSAERVRGVLSTNASVTPPVVLPITGPPPRPGTIEIAVGEG